jgi:hypothetical protein
LPDIAHSHSVALHGRLGPHDISIWRPLARVMSAACHTLLVAHLPNWDKSEGIADEVMCFEQAGKPIFDLDPATLVSTRRGHGVPHQQKRFEAMTLAELHAERAGWDAQIKAAKAWGASLAAAAEFRNACDVWIARREAEPVLAHRQDTVPAGRLVRMRLFFFNVELQLGQAINPLEASRPFEASARDSFCGVFHPRKSFGNHYAVQVIKRGRYRLLVTSLYSVIVEAVHGAAADLRKGRQDVPHLTEFGWRAGKRHLELAGQTHCAESSGISPSIRRRCSIAFFDDVVAKRLERSLHLFERLNIGFELPPPKFLLLLAARPFASALVVYLLPHCAGGDPRREKGASASYEAASEIFMGCHGAADPLGKLRLANRRKASSFARFRGCPGVGKTEDTDDDRHQRDENRDPIDIVATAREKVLEGGPKAVGDPISIHPGMMKSDFVVVERVAA